MRPGSIEEGVADGGVVAGPGGAGRGRARGRCPGAVAGLSAPRRAERERAAKGLEALGEAARPALIEAAGSNDLELRARAAAVLDAIEGQALGRATPVVLDFRDVPLADVLGRHDRTGLGLRGSLAGPGGGRPHARARPAWSKAPAGAKGGWITLRDAVKKALPKDAPKPGKFRLPALTRLARRRRAEAAAPADTAANEGA